MLDNLKDVAENKNILSAAVEGTALLENGNEIEI